MNKPHVAVAAFMTLVIIYTWIVVYSSHGFKSKPLKNLIIFSFREKICGKKKKKEVC